MVELEILQPRPIDVDLHGAPPVDVEITGRIIAAGSYLPGEHISIVNNEISVITTDTVAVDDLAPVTSNAVANAIAALDEATLLRGVSDEFIISDEKVLSIGEISVDKVSGIDALIAEALNFPIATDSLAGLVRSSSAADQINVGANGTMTVNSVNVNKLYQDADTEIVMYGGDSDY